MWAFVAPAHIPLANTQHATIAKITAWKHTTPEVKSMGRYVQASSRKGGKQKPTNNNTALHLKDNLLNLAYKIVIKCDHLCQSSSMCHFLAVVTLLLLSHFSVSDSMHLRTAACQAPLSMGFSRPGYWSGLPCPLPGHLPNPGIEFTSPALKADSSLLSHQGILPFLSLVLKGSILKVQIKVLNDVN